jgi:hypothetical protein
LVQGKVQSVAEVPFVFGRREGGISKAGLKTGLQYFQLLCRLWKQKS